MAFAEEGSPAFFAGAFDVVQATYLDEPKVADAFRTGKGVGWHEHSKCLSPAPNASSGRAITPISFRTGFRH